MDTFELDSDAFYICTEVGPRNFVVQKAIQIDRGQIERMVGKFDGSTGLERAPSADNSLGTSSGIHSPGTSTSTPISGGGAGAPRPPPLPYWFNRDCKSTLMTVGPQSQGPGPVSTLSASNHFVPALPVAPSLSREEIKQQLKVQLEYYFSRENLIGDRYLKCQMDTEHYVPINVVAGFNKIIRLTNDIDLVVEALKESAIVELDENEEKVRAISKRTTIIIREIPEEFREEVEKLLSDGPQFTELVYGCNDSWYVTYENELDTQLAYVAVQHKKNEITQKPVCARIKAGGPPSVAPPTDGTNGDGRFATLSNGEAGTFQLRELGQSLAEFGFVPVATYRPGESVLSHFEYVTPTLRFSGNNVSYQSSLPSQQPLQQQYYYPSSVSTTPRNFDELSTASSNSTRTTTSNYNRSGSRSSGGGGGGSSQNQYIESRSNSSNEWRGSNSGGRFQNGNQNQNRYQPQQNGRGNWRSGYRTATNGHTNNRQSGGQNGYHRSSQPSQSSQNWWTSSGNENNRSDNRNNEYHRHNGAASSSSSSSAASSSTNSSVYYSPEAIETPTNSGPSTPPPSSKADRESKKVYNVPTPTDLPPPPVWPAPSFDRRRKSSEASSTTITTTTNTLTPSTPVTPPIHRPVFVDASSQLARREVKDQNGTESTPKSAVVETWRNNIVEKMQSPPPSAPVVSPSASVAAHSFAFEETAFPSLPKKVEPVKPPQKPTFR